MSVANKDEALKCINIAQRCINEGNTEKARKFLNKSLALHELDIAKDLLESLNNTSSSSRPTATKSDDTQKRTNPPPSSENTKECTKEMLESVNLVKGKKDYYAILGVSKEATDAELKKAYRKLALALHPDKNFAAGAQDAFKNVGKAYGILSNKDKRAHFDRYGSEESCSSSPRSSYYNRHRNRNYYEYEEEDISPEELFNMFFGGMQPDRRRRFYNTRSTQQENTGGNNRDASMISSLLQMSPLLLLILMSMLNSLFTEDPVYSFHRNGNYKVERATTWNQIRYYVKGDFTEKYTNEKVLYYEYDIEREWKSDLQMKCINNSRRKEQLLYQYRVTGNQRYRDYANSMDLTACEDYKKFKLPQYIGG